LYNRSAKTLADFLREFVLPAFEEMFRPGKRQVPILFDLQSTVLPERVMPGGKLANSFEHRRRVRHPEKRQVLIECFPIDGGLDPRDFQ
jgi:hypothetical protein